MFEVKTGPLCRLTVRLMAIIIVAVFMVAEHNVFLLTGYTFNLKIVRNLCKENLQDCITVFDVPFPTVDE